MYGMKYKGKEEEEKDTSRAEAFLLGNSPDLLDAPLLYAGSFGWPVFPLQGLDGTGDAMKQPLPGSRGFKDATSDIEEVAQAFKKSRGRYGVGVATGEPLGLWVLDIDGEPGAEALAVLTSKLGKLPETVTAKTGGGGWHLFFKMPEDRTIRNSSSKVAEKIDVRGTGGYVVLPPSPHPSGNFYGWMPKKAPGEIEPATAPLWLLDLVSPPEPLFSSYQMETPKPAENRKWNVRPPSGYVDTDSEDWPAHAAAVFNRQIRGILEAQVGQRNDTLYRASFVLGRLIKTGSLADVPVRAALAVAARIVGLGREESDKTINSGILAGQVTP
jgi:hypothetical protein